MVQTIGQLFAHSSKPLAVHARDPVLYAVRTMNEGMVGSVLVLDESERLVGIFTERDVLTRVIEGRCDARKTPVRDVMTATPVTIDADCTLDDAFALMDDHEVCHLPVIDRGEVIGVVALRDLSEVATELLGYENRVLHRYIHGPLARAEENYV